MNTTLDQALKLADQDCPLPSLAGPALKLLRERVRELEGKQAARVDEGMVEERAREMYEAYRFDNKDSRMYSWRDQLFEPTKQHWRDEARAALEAALSAKPAPERQGEVAVGIVHDFGALDWLGGNCPKAGTKLYTHPAAPVGVPEPLPMDAAPRDGTMLRLLVRFTEHATDDAEKAWTIGSNSFDANGEDIWQFAGWCWTHDHFTEGEGTPIGWLPMLAAAPSAPQGTQQGEVVIFLDETINPERRQYIHRVEDAEGNEIALGDRPCGDGLTRIALHTHPERK